MLKWKWSRRPIGAGLVGVCGGGEGEGVEPHADGGELGGGFAGGAELAFKVEAGEEAKGAVAFGGEVFLGGGDGGRGHDPLACVPHGVFGGLGGGGDPLGEFGVACGGPLVE